MAIDFSKFNKNIDLDEMHKEIEKAAEKGTGDFPEVPHGTYECRVDKLELTESKSGKVMATCWFEILEGQYKGARLFMNQVVEQAFQIHIVNELLRSFGTDVDVEFVDYVQYAQLLLDVHEAIEEKGLEYAVEYGERKGFNTFKIQEVFLPEE